MNKLILMLLCMGFSASFAQNQKIAVLDIKARSGIDPMTVSSLTDYSCTVIDGMGKYDVIGKDDMQAMLEHIADKQLLECDDTKCLAQIGGALGVELLMAGNIGMVGKMYLINFKLINIEEAQVHNRISVEYLGDETGLVAKVKESVNQLFGVTGAAATAPVTAPEKSDVIEEPETVPEEAAPVRKKPLRKKRPGARQAAAGRKWRLVVIPGAHYNFYTEGVGFSQQLGLQFGRIYTGVQLVINDHDYDDSQFDAMGNPIYVDVLDTDFNGLAAVMLYRFNRHPAVGFHAGLLAGFYDGYYTYLQDDPFDMNPMSQEDYNMRVFSGFKIRLDFGGRRIRGVVESMGLIGPEDEFRFGTMDWDTSLEITGQIDAGLMILF